MACSLLVPGGKTGIGEGAEGAAWASCSTCPRIAELGSNSAPSAMAASSELQMASLCAAIAGSSVKKVPSYKNTPANSRGARLTVASAELAPAEKPPSTGFWCGLKDLSNDNANSASCE